MIETDELLRDTSWKPGDRIDTAADYLASVAGRDLAVYLMGERVAEPLTHPIIRPSINAMAATYALAQEDPDLATAQSSLSGLRVNRFLHVTESVEDVVDAFTRYRRNVMNTPFMSGTMTAAEMAAS